MYGIKAIIKKELADHFSSYRFIILFALITMVSLIMVYMVGLNIREELDGIKKPSFVFLMLFTSSGAVFSLVQFVAIFGPLIGLILGFDTINRERNEGTLSKLLSQPIYRDSIINGKFLAGVILIAIMMIAIIMLITGLGLIVIGVIPGIEEVFRILLYLVISIIYISFWLGAAILFSILFRTVATSALATLATWIFFSFFISMVANTAASAIMPNVNETDPNEVVQRYKLQKAILLISPMVLYSESTGTIIDPKVRTTSPIINMGFMEKISMSRFSGPLPLSQSFLVVLPYIIFLIAITVICFALSYLVFMRQEIRSI